jgi:hypothetical protein
MDNLLQSALDWSEVWSLFIPLVVVLLIKKQRPAFLKPVVIYVWLALAINLIIDFIWVFKRYLPAWLQSNNPYYNIHAITRFACFSIFFMMLPQVSFGKLKKTLVVASAVFILINFFFFENFFDPGHLSGNLLATEAYLLLIYCLQYYLAELRNDGPSIFNGPDFWVVTGLGIYVVISFFVFLFYLPMLQIDPVLSDRMWNFHNIAFIIFCIFLTKALYGPFRNKYSV